MARNKSSHKRTGRVVSHNATRSVPRFTPSVRLSPLTIIEDRRTFHPERDHRPALSFSGRPHTLTTVQRPPSRAQVKSPYSWRPSSQTRALVAFEAPDRVLVCVRRNQRKQVLHALKKTGRVGQKKPRRNWFSSISCRS